MSNSTITLIAIVVIAAIALIAVIALVSRKKRTDLRRAEAAHLREAAEEETLVVRQREARADELAARARAAKAEADIKAAQAEALQLKAAAHRNEAAASREHLDEKWVRADSIDPVSESGTIRSREPQDH